MVRRIDSYKVAVTPVDASWKEAAEGPPEEPFTPYELWQSQAGIGYTDRAGFRLALKRALLEQRPKREDHRGADPLSLLLQQTALVVGDMFSVSREGW
ncbi:MAG: hypothetical protein ACYC6Y_22745 [Thermoguttaceae bacterium]